MVSYLIQCKNEGMSKVIDLISEILPVFAWGKILFLYFSLARRIVMGSMACH